MTDSMVVLFMKHSFIKSKYNMTEWHADCFENLLHSHIYPWYWFECKIIMIVNFWKWLEFLILAVLCIPACCAALTELVLNDTNAQQIVQANGIYSLGLLILPQDVQHKLVKTIEKLQVQALSRQCNFFLIEL